MASGFARQGFLGVFPPDSFAPCPRGAHALSIGDGEEFRALTPGRVAASRTCALAGGTSGNPAVAAAVKAPSLTQPKSGLSSSRAGV